MKIINNFDNKKVFSRILQTLSEISLELPIIFPVHPRTKKMAKQYGLDRSLSEGDPVQGLWITEPLGYLQFLNLNMNARCVITDSGGLQEETTVLGIPCVTLRENTERPVTCQAGTNQLIGNEPEKNLSTVKNILKIRTWKGRFLKSGMERQLKELSNSYCLRI